MNNKQTPQQPLWSDDRIADELADVTDDEEVASLLIRMRDDLTAERATFTAQLESMTIARDHWYNRAIHHEHGRATLMAKVETQQEQLDNFRRANEKWDEIVLNLEWMLTEKNKRIIELEAKVAEQDTLLEKYRQAGEHWEDLTQGLEARIAELEVQLTQAQAGQDEAIATLKLVYRKHYLSDDSIGWDELSDAVLDTLSNLMGVDELVRWQEGSES